MKKLILAAALTAGLAAALPAAAQSWSDRGDVGFGGGRAQAIEMRIERGVRNGELSRWEARSLVRQLDDIRDLERRDWRDGRISVREADELDRRFAELSARLRFERHDGDRNRDWNYGSGYGRGGFGGYR